MCPYGTCTVVCNAPICTPGMKYGVAVFRAGRVLIDALVGGNCWSGPCRAGRVVFAFSYVQVRRHRSVFLSDVPSLRTDLLSAQGLVKDGYGPVLQSIKLARAEVEIAKRALDEKIRNPTITVSNEERSAPLCQPPLRPPAFLPRATQKAAFSTPQYSCRTPHCCNGATCSSLIAPSYATRFSFVMPCKCRIVVLPGLNSCFVDC